MFIFSAGILPQESDVQSRDLCRKETKMTAITERGLYRKLGLGIPQWNKASERKKERMTEIKLLPPGGAEGTRTMTNFDKFCTQ